MCSKNLDTTKTQKFHRKEQITAKVGAIEGIKASLQSFPVLVLSYSGCYLFHDSIVD